MASTILKRNEFAKADVYDLYNAIQFPLSKLFIDIRSTPEYKTMHVNHSIHLPITVCEDDIINLFKDKFFYHIVYVYSNQTQINNNKDILFYNKIQNILSNKLQETEHKFYVLDVNIQQFFTLFPYLTVKNDNIYWNAIINTNNDNKNKNKKKIQNKKIQKKKKKKKCIVNMIDIYYKRLSAYQQYPNQIINNKLYLGMKIQAEKKEILNNLNITHIINVTPINYIDMDVIIGREYFQISIWDVKDVDISDYFESTYQFIDNALNINNNNNDDNDQKINNQITTNRVFVHCKEGVSRSATIVIAYLMKSQKMTLDDALSLVKSRREVVDPNNGFIEQLKEFEKNNYSVKTKKH